MSEGDRAEMDDMTTDELRELLALAAVGALDAAELARLRARIADRPDLQDELAGYEAAAASLADAVAETPPPALRASVLAAIHDVPQSGAPAVPASPEVADATVVPITAARRRRWTPVAAIAGAAAAAVVAVVGVGVLDGDDDDGGGQLAAADLVEAPDAVTIAFDGQEDGFALVHSPQHGAVALIGDDIPELAEEQVYELWIVQDDTPEPMEIFAPDDDGEVEVVIPDMAPPEGATFAITIEPPGGSDRPTSTAIASTA